MVALRLLPIRICLVMGHSVPLLHNGCWQPLIGLSHQPCNQVKRLPSLQLGPYETLVRSDYAVLHRSTVRLGNVVRLGTQLRLGSNLHLGNRVRLGHVALWGDVVRLDIL